MNEVDDLEEETLLETVRRVVWGNAVGGWHRSGVEVPKCLAMIMTVLVLVRL